MANGNINLITELAESFWKEAGLPYSNYPIPCTLLEQAICLLLPINIVRLNKLSAHKVVTWLAERNCIIDLKKDCPLCGLLFIQNGQGIIFINGTLPTSEQSYTLAHEIGHYIIEFEHPLKKASSLLNKGIEDVFRGIRKPTIEEELTGIIKRVNTSPYIHFLEYEYSSVEQRFKVWAAEDRADAFAFELLAPFSIVFTEMNFENSPWTFKRVKEELPTLLTQKFGLPSSVVTQYSTAIAYRLFPHGYDFIARLKQL